MQNILVAIVVSIIAITSFAAIYKSLTFLKSKSVVLNYYEFDSFIPAANTWSVVFYIVVISLLLLFAFILMKNTGVVLRPA